MTSPKAIIQASCFTDSGSIAEWDDSSLNERVYLGKSVLPRFCSIHETIAVITLEGCPVNYELINIILLALPCLFAPDDFFKELVKRYYCYETLDDLSPATIEQIHLKILVILRCWARSMSCHSDFSGLLIENILDFINNIIEESNFPTIIAAAKKVRSTLRIVKDDLREYNVALLTYYNKVDSLSLFPSSATETSPRDHLNSHDFKNSLESINISPLNNDESDISRRNYSSSIDIRTSVGSLQSVSLMENIDSTATILLNLPDDIQYVDDGKIKGKHSVEVDKKLIFEDHFSRPVPTVPNPLIEETYQRSSSQPVMMLTTFSNLADILTIIEYEYFLLSLRPREFINKGWTRNETRLRHPDIGGSMHLTNLNLWTNQMIAWIATEILDYTYQYGSSMSALEYFIRVARSAFKLNNFNTCFQIIMALGLPAIQRLKTGWSQLPRKKQDLYKSYVEIFDNKNNFNNYRKKLNSIPTDEPRVPCIQVVLKDIYSLETSGPWRIGGKMDLKKASTLYNILSNFIHLDDTDPVNYTVKIYQYSSYQDNKTDSTDISPSNSFTLNHPHHSNSFTMTSQISSTISTTTSPKTSTVNNITNSPQPKLLSTKLSSEKIIIPSSNTNILSTKLSSEKLIATTNNNTVKLSFLNNCKIVRESLFQSLHDSYFQQKQQKIQSQQNQNVTNEQQVGSLESILSNNNSKLVKENIESLSNIVITPKKAPQPMSQTISTSFTPPNGNNRVSSADKSSSQRLSSNSSNSTTDRRQSGARSMFSGIFRALSGSNSSTNPFELIANDEEIGKLLYRVLRIDADLKRLWDYSEAADIAENDKLMGKLARSGLY